MFILAQIFATVELSDLAVWRMIWVEHIFGL